MSDMQIRGLVLPNQFVVRVESGFFRRAQGSWQLREKLDAYGNALETELGYVYETAEKIEQESTSLARGFPPEYADLPNEFASWPGFIPDITDFSRVLTFAIAGDGAPFCFDYRNGDPSVIWWDDAYWRRIAPSFTEFLDLFDFERPV